MKKYTSCFIGVALPQKYVKEFGQVLHAIHTIDASIETVQPQTPHITIYYLNKQSQNVLGDITKKIQPLTNILHGKLLTVGGLGYFTQNKPSVLFLNVVYPETFIEYRNNLAKVLAEYSASDNHFLFHPHMTIGRIVNSQTQKSFKKNEKEIAAKLHQIRWEFEINEITLYGVDSTKSPQQQEKLASIALK